MLLVLTVLLLELIVMDVVFCNAASTMRQVNSALV
jgi:hypothetical protein